VILKEEYFFKPGIIHLMVYPLFIFQKTIEVFNVLVFKKSYHQYIVLIRGNDELIVIKVFKEPFLNSFDVKFMEVDYQQYF